MTPPTRRAGVGVLVAALGLLGVLLVFAAFQRSLSRQAMGEVHRGQLAALARLRARTALAETLARVGREVNEPGTRLFVRSRWSMDDPWQELELTEDLAPARQEVAARWGDLAKGAEAGAELELLDRWARIRFPRSARDPRGTEEWVGVLELGAVGRASDLAGSATRELVAAHEIRAALIAPPRPFDQLGLYLGQAGGLLDLARANSVREEAVQGHLQLRAELAAAGSELGSTDRKWLGQIVDGMLTAEQLEARVPRMPSGPVALQGFTRELHGFRLRELDLTSRLETVRARVETRRAAYASAPPGRGRYEQAYWLVDEYSNIFDALWQTGSWVTTLVPHDSEAWRKRYEPYLDRLRPGYFLDRVQIRPGEEDPLFHAWRAMGRRLEGVVDVSHWTRPLVLEGELQGRVVLLVGPRGVTLRDLNWGAANEGHRLVVVSMGGPVTVEGKVHAAVLMLPPADSPEGFPGNLRVGFGAHLRGSLIVPRADPGRLSLEGVLEYDPFFRAAYPPRETLASGTRGEYVVTVSPRPLYMKERAR